jgi:hypothetical protein
VVIGTFKKCHKTAKFIPELPGFENFQNSPQWIAALFFRKPFSVEFKPTPATQNKF